MGEVIGALRDKRSELAGMVSHLERELVERRASLTHLDATMRLFDPNSRPDEIRPRQPRAHNTWFRPGECLRLIYDMLRDAPGPLTTRELAEQIMDAKARLHCIARRTTPYACSPLLTRRASSRQAASWA